MIGVIEPNFPFVLVRSRVDESRYVTSSSGDGGNYNKPLMDERFVGRTGFFYKLGQLIN